jgi:hypothetical protein
MKEIKIKVSNISNRQWANLLVELNLVKEMWKKHGPKLDIKARNFGRIVKWGKRKHDERDKDDA